MDGAEKGLLVRGAGADQLGDIRNLPSVLQEAYEMGKTV